MGKVFLNRVRSNVSGTRGKMANEGVTHYRDTRREEAFQPLRFPIEDAGDVTHHLAVDIEKNLRGEKVGGVLIIK